MTVDEFLDHIKKQANVTSDRRLGELLQKQGTIIHQYRKRGILPSDDTMIKLANLGDFDPDDALLLLNVWRTTGRAKKRYSAMLARRTAIAIGLFIFASPLIYNDSFAQESGKCDFNHYYEKFNRIFKRIINDLRARLATWKYLYLRSARNMKPISLAKFYLKPLPT